LANIPQKTAFLIGLQYFCGELHLPGLDLLFATIENVKVRINPTRETRGILPTVVDGRTVHASEGLDAA
jgi:hypothetical protein